jgi:hypothetical protein
MHTQLREARVRTLFALVIMIGATMAAAEVPPDSSWQIAGTERVAVRALGRRFVQRGLVSSVLEVDAERRWSIQVSEDTAYAVTLGGTIEDRRRNRFRPRVDAASREAFGAALKQLVIDQGADAAHIQRSRIHMRGRERTDGTLRIRSVATLRIRVRLAGRSVPMTLRAVDRWSATPIE